MQFGCVTAICKHKAATSIDRDAVNLNTDLESYKLDHTNVAPVDLFESKSIKQMYKLIVYLYVFCVVFFSFYYFLCVLRVRFYIK